MTYKKILLYSLPFLIFLLAIRYNIVEQNAHFTPSYVKVDLHPILQEKELSLEDYRLLFYQTGLAPSAVDSILADRKSALETLRTYQECFFAPVEVSCTFNTPISKEERLLGSTALLAPLADADILITSASHVLIYRNGHTGLVIDAANEISLEAVSLGFPSSLQNIRKWKAYPNFVILRLSENPNGSTAKVTNTALEKLNNIPYRLTAGIFTAPPNTHSSIVSTNCSHLVWSAFYVNEIDLDSDGGSIVTPNDILNSPYLEPIQIYGLNPADFEDRLF